MPKLAYDPPVSPAQRRLMEAAAHTAGGYGGVSQAVAKKFLSDDMSQEEWSGLIDGIEKFLKEERREPAHASDRQIVDFGPKSTRKYDEQNGFLHVRCHISAARVNPYRGSEIPGAAALGLDPDKIYQLLRDPEELAKGADTFHNVPLMSGETGMGGGHPAGGVTSSDEHLIKIGSIANPSFEHPYLDADVVIWNDTPIAGVETDTVRELSSSYGYTPVMEPGEFEGTKYDGRMTAIHANHVALVEAGRAGSDVIVGDAALDLLESGEFLMPLKPRISVRSALARGVIVGMLRPKLAADAKLDMTGINTVLKTLDSKNWLRQKPRLATAIRAAAAKTKLKLALDEEEVEEALDSLDEEAEDGELEEEDGAEDEKGEEEDETEEEKGEDEAEDEEDREEREEHRKEAKDRRAKDKRMGRDASEEEREEAEKEHKAEDKRAWDARMKARDARRAKDRKGMDKKAMDAAIAAAERRTENRVLARLNSVRQAEADVLPYVGQVNQPGTVAMDSAEEIYRFALDEAGIENSHVKDVGALRSMVGMLPKAGAAPVTGEVAPRFANDRASAGSNDWLKTFIRA